jgi:RNA polymerase primary sigma factor
MRAVELYDPDLGLKFSTYATHWIRQAILRGLDDCTNTIRLPIHRQESIRRFLRAKRVLWLELGRRPSIRELAEALDWKPDKIAYIQLLSAMRIEPIDTPANERGLTLGDLLMSPIANPEQVCLQAELKRAVHGLLETLGPRQRMVLMRRFGLANGREETLQEIGDDLEVTRERVRQIEGAAMKRVLSKAKFIGAAQFL